MFKFICFFMISCFRSHFSDFANKKSDIVIVNSNNNNNNIRQSTRKVTCNFLQIINSYSKYKKSVDSRCFLPRSSNKLMWRSYAKKKFIPYFPIYQHHYNDNALSILLRRFKFCNSSTYVYSNFIVSFQILTIVRVLKKLPTNVSTEKKGLEFGRLLKFPVILEKDFFFNKQLYISGMTNTIFFCNTNVILNFIFIKWLVEISHVLYFYLFIKIKYKGKSYKWLKKNASLVLRFGYSHIVFSKIPNYFFCRKIGKMKLVFYGTASWELQSFLSELICWRPMNVYNGRGLRFARQLVFRKFGKVSVYR